MLCSCSKSTMINILFIAILFFFSVTIFVVFLHFYAKWFWFPDPRRTTNVIYARRSFVFGSNDVETAAGERRKGLDAEVINTLKTLVYKSDDPSMSSKEGIDCAVCLSEVTDGETIRLLPKCNHGFHVECIDMWFFSHSTCPLCRNAVVDEKPVIDNDSGSTELVSGNGYSTELPPNVLFWGNHDQGGVSASGGGVVAARTESREGVLVLDIPRRVLTEDDLKSPATGTPMSARFGSLKRFLSREKKAATSPSSSSSSSHHPPLFSGDVEQGIRQADM